MKRILLLGTLILGLASLGACKEAQAKKISGVGDTLTAFLVKNCSSKETYCQVCKFGGKPTIMAIGQLDDEGFKKDLAGIQKIVDAGKDKSLTAFALVGEKKGGQWAPFSDEKAAVEKLDKMTKELGITFPVVVLPSKKTDKGYPEFNAVYQISSSRTVLLAEADNKVVFSDVIQDAKADDQFKALEAKTKSL